MPEITVNVNVPDGEYCMDVIIRLVSQTVKMYADYFWAYLKTIRNYPPALRRANGRRLKALQIVTGWRRNERDVL